MFALHETTQIRVLRMAYLALCVLPTCAVIGLCAWVNAPAYRQAHERQIAAWLGWQARLARVRTPRPGTLLYEDLRLTDPATGQAIARLPFVEIERSEIGLVVRLPHPATLNGAHLDRFWQLIAEQQREPSSSTPLWLEAHNLTVRLPTGDHSLTDVSGQLTSVGLGTRARLKFHRAQRAAAAESCLLTFALDGQGRSERRVVQLATGSTPLPSLLFSLVWPEVARLGRGSQFAGRITAVEESGVWRTDVEGRAEGVDLDLLVSRQFPHKLTGLAEVQLDSVTLAGGRIERAAGHLTAGPGVVSRSLVQSAETHLRIQAAPRALRGPGNLIAYEQLNLGFEIDEQGLALRGRVPGARGALLVDARQVLAVESPLEAQPVVDLVRTLVPRSEVHVPATRETARLTGALPVPSIALAPGSEEPLPRARPLSVNPLRSGGTIR